MCTPSEAGAFAVVYAILIGVFVYREMTFKSFCDALLMSMMDNAAVMMLVAMSGPFSYAVTYVNLPQSLASFIFGITTQPQLLVHHHSGVPVYHGSVLGQQRELLLLTPIFLPMMKKVGVDPVHFGVLMATIVTMGVMTPPVGSALYTVCGILKCPVEEYTKEALPFFLAVMLEMIVLVFFPNVVLFLPNLIYG